MLYDHLNWPTKSFLSASLLVWSSQGFQFLKTLIELLVQIFALQDAHPTIQRA